MAEHVKPFHYTAFSQAEKGQESQQNIESVVRKRVQMERKFERLELVLHVLQHYFGVLPDDLSMAIHIFTYDELYDLLDAVLDASSLDEVINVSNRMMANDRSFNTKWA